MPEEAGSDRPSRSAGKRRCGARCAAAARSGAATPTAEDRTDQLLLLAEDAAKQALWNLREQQRWPGFAEVCATRGFVHWCSREAVKRRQAG